MAPSRLAAALSPSYSGSLLGNAVALATETVFYTWAAYQITVVIPGLPQAKKEAAANNVEAEANKHKLSLGRSLSAHLLAAK